MKWVNRNRSKYLYRYLFPLVIIILVISLLELIIYLTDKSGFYHYTNAIIVCLALIPSIYSWAIRAKYNIQSIEIKEDTNSITLTYFLYDNIKSVTCNTSHIKIELRARYQGDYLSVYQRNDLILNQEDIYWKSDLNLQGLHKELKKHLPEGRVVVI